MSPIRIRPMPESFPSSPSPRFVHLRFHSEYSIQDSILRVDEAIKLAKADAMPALALTDLGNVFGLVKFYSAARKKGLKPIDRKSVV